MLKNILSKYYIKTITVLLLSLTPIKSYSTTIHESIVAAYNNNPEILSKYNNIKAQDENIRQAFSGWLPSIFLNIVYNDNIKSSETEETEEIKIVQNLFNGGGTILEVKAAKYNSLASKYDFLTTVQKVFLDTIAAHIDIVKSVKLLNLNKKNLAAFKKYLKITKERFTFKEVSKTDLAQAEASVSKANRDLILEKGNLKVFESRYKSITGIKAINIQAPKNYPDFKDTNLNELIEIALKENPIIKIAENNLKAGKVNIARQKSYLLPKIDLNFTKSHEESNDSSTENQEYIGVNIQLPIYQSGSQYSKIRQSKFLLEQQFQALRQEKLQVINDTIASYENLNTSKASIEANKVSIIALKTALEGTISEAKFGERTTLDVLEAEFSLFSAKSNLISTERDEIFNIYSLLLQIGKLNTTDLDLKVKKYDTDSYRKTIKYKFIGF